MVYPLSGLLLPVDITVRCPRFTSQHHHLFKVFSLNFNFKSISCHVVMVEMIFMTILILIGETQGGKPLPKWFVAVLQWI